MPRKKRNIGQDIYNAILDGLEQDASEWAVETELKYPKLRGSSILTRTNNKITVGFKSGKALAQLEEDIPARPIIGKYFQKVKRHQRKGTGKNKRGKTSVAAHTKTFKNYKPIQLRSGVWRMMNTIPKVEAKKPISKALRSRYRGKSMEKILKTAIENGMN